MTAVASGGRQIRCLAAAAAGLVMLCACEQGGTMNVALPPPAPPGPASTCVAVPEAHEWTYVGTALQSGAEGAFDRLLWGGFGGAALRVGDEILLYYQGAGGYSEVQQSVHSRSIGLAVSDDGTNFVKDAASPVLAWSPNSGEEEGAASVAVTVGPEGNIVAFYGANTMTGPTTVSADVRWADSTDGRRFTDRGIALDHGNPQVAGWGDELFPVIAFFHGDHWYVYYIPNGKPRGELGVAVGRRPDLLSQTAPVRVGRRQVQAWGMQSAAHVCGTTYALFLNEDSPGTMTVRLIDAQTPDIASEPVATYQFSAAEAGQGFSQGAVLLDHQTGYWYLYHRNEDASSYVVRRAPVRTR